MANVKTPPLTRGSTAFLQAVIALVGVGVLAFLLWEPHVEGVNAHATLVEKYASVFVAYAYVASVPFFVAVYQAINVLGYVRKEKVFSPEAVRSVRTIKWCAVAVLAFVAASVAFMIGGDREDRPGGIFMRALVAFPSAVVAAVAAMFERVLQRGVDMKSENDLTV